VEMAVWQCRGMNMVQNINDEIYDLDDVLSTIYGIAAVMTGIAWAFEALSEIPYIGEIFKAIGDALMEAAAIMAQIAYYCHKVMVNYFLAPLRTFYVYGSMALGYIGANNVAYANGAERVIPKIPVGSGGSGIWHAIVKAVKKVVNNMTGQFVAVGIPTSPYAALYLPLTTEDADTLPLNTKDPGGVGGKAYIALMVLLCSNEDLTEYCGGGGGGGDESVSSSKSDSGGGDEGVSRLPWKDDPYVSRDPDSLKIAPMIWIVHQSGDVGLVSEYFLGGNSGEDTKIPILAYAVGQAMGGNVTQRSSDDNPYRPPGKGVAADAFLVPMNSIDFSKEASAMGISIKLTFQDYIDKLFAH